MKNGIQIEAAFPVMHPVETGEIHSRMLDAVPALVLLHYGAAPDYSRDRKEDL